jgi:hypothetical protein
LSFPRTLEIEGRLHSVRSQSSRCDHPDKVARGVTLDIVPTLLLFETIGQKEATSSWHFFFLIQGHGLPEHMIGSDPEFFLRHMFAALLYYLDAIEPAAWAEYLRCFRVAAMRPRGQTAPVIRAWPATLRHITCVCG